jgi:ABC-type multidrug transport system fused ATPase/permease subunit
VVLSPHAASDVDLWLAELVGLSLSYVLLLNATLYNAVWLVSQLENKMVSVERIAQYSKLPSEAPAVVEQTRPPKSWPSQGTIMFNDLKVSSHPEIERWRSKGNCT